MNKSTVKSLVNGIAADYLNINDRAIHYGDGIFETILCDSNKIYYWRKHYQRLLDSANRLQLACPDEQIFLNDIEQLLLENTDADNKLFAIKIILTRGTGERGYQFSKKTRINRIISLSELNTDYSSLLTGQLLNGELMVCRQQVSINENLAGLKHLNRLENVLARNEWNDEYIDGLMLNANQFVIEGTMSNLFAVKDKQLLTPDLKQSGVDGIMRNEIMAIAGSNNIKLSVVNITLDELLTMDELFICNSLIAIKTVSKLVITPHKSTQYKQTSLTDMIFNTLVETRDDHAQTV
jgi:4-amino-4-deoxychorismate lyase